MINYINSIIGRNYQQSILIYIESKKLVVTIKTRNLKKNSIYVRNGAANI